MSEPRRSSRHWLLASLGWAVVILAATSIPNPESPLPPPPGADKVAHVLMYLPLAFLASRWRGAIAREAAPRTGGPAIVVPLQEIVVLGAGLLLFAAVDELHQHFIPGRSCDLLDWVADASAILLGVPAGLWKRR